MSQSYYRKWRPRQWEEVVGQEHIVQTLRNAVAGNRVAHAYLFAGPRGTGKTTTARLLAKAVNCLDPDPAHRPCNQCEHCKSVNEGTFLDLIEIDAASNTSVEDVRDLRDKINYSPNQGAYKVYIIDEVHMLSTAAFNALLKTLEEPPEHAIFILATTEIHKIPATVLSRCQRHEFRRIPLGTIVNLLRTQSDVEGLDVEQEALTTIARQSTGSMRDAISLLDQLASTGKKITLAEAQTMLGTATSQSVIDLVNAILDKDAAAGLTHIHTTLDTGTDPRQFARQVVDYLRNILLVRTGNHDQIDAPDDVRQNMMQQSHRFRIPDLIAAIRAFNDAAVDEHGGWHPGLPLELAFTDSMGGSGATVDPLAFTSAPTVPASTPVSTPADKPVHAVVPPPVERTPTPAVRPPEPAQPRPQTPTQPPKPAAAAQPQARAEETHPAEPPVSEPAGAQPAISLQTIIQSWQRIRVSIKKNYSQTEALLNSSKPLGIKDGALLLGFASDLLKSKMEMGNHLEVTRQAIQLVTGAKLDIRCVIASGKGGSSLPPDMDVDSEGIVGTATRDLGAEIVDVQ